MTYARGTEVSVSGTLDEIQRTLRRFDATAFSYGWADDPPVAVLAFTATGRRVRFTMPLPDRADYKYTPTGRGRDASTIDREWEQGIRERWRALAAVVKAKLVAVEANITTFEQEFLAHIVLPGTDETVWDQIRAPLAYAYEKGLPALPSPSRVPSSRLRVQDVVDGDDDDIQEAEVVG